MNGYERFYKKWTEDDLTHSCPQCQKEFFCTNPVDKSCRLNEHPLCTECWQLVVATGMTMLDLRKVLV